MSLMGIDVGTTGCKAAVFRQDGTMLALAYREYDVQRPAPGCAELDPQQVWVLAKSAIAEAASGVSGDPVSAICISSMGEAVIPVSEDRRILGPSMLNFDERGMEFLPCLRESMPAQRLYEINGNTLGNQYTLTKLLWTRQYRPEVWEQTWRFLHWAGFVAHMLGGEAAVDYSLANRTLLFDIDNEGWSPELASRADVPSDKLPEPVPTGTVVGTVTDSLASELGLRSGVSLVLGAHDQCANAVGCGVVRPGHAMVGMGTFCCIAPVFAERPAAGGMMPYGLNTEHAAPKGQYISFIFNHAGSILKWYRDTFAPEEARLARVEGRDIYPDLLSEIPLAPSSVMVLPHFAPTGPPEFIEDSSGVIMGLKLETRRGDILKGILEGVVFYLREALEPALAAGIPVDEFRAVGGGSRSPEWLQIYADILGRPLRKMVCEEAGTLGSAIIAGAATGVFASIQEGADATVRFANVVEPAPARVADYDRNFARYRNMWPMMQDIIRQK